MDARSLCSLDSAIWTKWTLKPIIEFFDQNLTELQRKNELSYISFSTGPNIVLH